MHMCAMGIGLKVVVAEGGGHAAVEGGTLLMVEWRAWK